MTYSQEYVDALNAQIIDLQNQVNSLTYDLSMKQGELDELNIEVLTRIQDIENKLNDTTSKTDNNTLSITEMQSSLVADITSDLGLPRFGIQPLPIAKQALAVTREILTDPNTGHIYIKGTDNILSKTKDNEQRLDIIDNYMKSIWMAVSVDYTNYLNFIDESDTSIYTNSDNTFSSSTNNMIFKNINVRYNKMTKMLVAIKLSDGAINNVYFVDSDDVVYNTTLVNSNSLGYLYELDIVPSDITNIYPKIILANNSKVVNILVYRDLNLNDIVTTNGLNSKGSNYVGTIGGNTDLGWKKLFRMKGLDRSGDDSNISATSYYDAGTVMGTIYCRNGNYYQGRNDKYNFQFTVHSWNGTSRIDLPYLFIPSGMPDIIRVIKYGKCDYELQVRSSSNWVHVVFDFYEAGNSNLSIYEYQNIVNSDITVTVVKDNNNKDTINYEPLTWDNIEGI